MFILFYSWSLPYNKVLRKNSWVNLEISGAYLAQSCSLTLPKIAKTPEITRQKRAELFLAWEGKSIKKPDNLLTIRLLRGWAHLDSNQGPPDYESGALTN